MTNPLRWGGEVFAALLPLGMGGLAIALADGNAWWSHVVGWVADGTLMPPAVLLALALVRDCRKFVASELRSAAEMILEALAIATVIIFSVSVRRSPDSTDRLAIVNAIAYASVVASCCVIVNSRRHSENTA